ncbi:MAG: hypothetical protein BM555_02760 [Crocinitomix sp. MedPE-SWsnd]|jgi:cobalamin biosynthesis protein CobD/CbiB|nr:MAG: hypothetical protein BM555_02760 [Crocinitomix sp. MedPE-SWsnd]
MEDEKRKAQGKRGIILWMIIGFVMMVVTLLSYPEISDVGYFIIVSVIVLEVISVYQLIKHKKNESNED